MHIFQIKNLRVVHNTINLNSVILFSGKPQHSKFNDEITNQSIISDQVLFNCASHSGFELDIDEAYRYQLCIANLLR